MYRNLTAGMQSAAIIHAWAFKQSTTNDRIRNIFKELLLHEVGVIDKLTKYGKVKGWLNPSPLFRVR